MFWQTTRHRIDLREPRVMGIVNVTPDSFSDGGRFVDARAAIDHARRLVDEGADILDIGGESTRPGAAPVSLEEERRRVLPVLEGLLGCSLPISLDTSKPELMVEALRMGVDIINDVRALADPDALSVVTSHPSCGVCLMHMRGTPLTMQSLTAYSDVVDEVKTFLSDRLQLLQTLGVATERVVVDPGIGFGKSVEQNFELLRRQRELLGLGAPVLAGWSRKSSLGAVTGRAAEDRMVGSVTAALAALLNGARIVRVHDVAATVDAFKVWRAAGLLEARQLESSGGPVHGA
jgi:dihydropteroate synthase